jgi:hypothetical protein
MAASFYALPNVLCRNHPTIQRYISWYELLSVVKQTNKQTNKLDYESDVSGL